jgi:hypothetical protein
MAEFLSDKDSTAGSTEQKDVPAEDGGANPKVLEPGSRVLTGFRCQTQRQKGLSGYFAKPRHAKTNPNLPPVRGSGNKIEVCIVPRFKLQAHRWMIGFSFAFAGTQRLPVFRLGLRNATPRLREKKRTGKRWEEREAG